MNNKQKLINVSNRLPVTLSDKGYVPAAGGLVSALSSLTKDYDFYWVGWLEGGPSKINEQRNCSKNLFAQFKYLPIFLSDNIIEGFYHGFSNSSLWPLLHNMAPYTEFKQEWHDLYVKGNEHFLKKIIDIANDNDIILIHDYHLFLLPSMLKMERPNLKVAFFLHTPFPSYEIFRCHPKRKEILEGLVGADLIGFHTFGYLRHFRSALLRLLNIESGVNFFNSNGSKKQIDVFPIGINWDNFSETMKSPEYFEILEKYKTQFKDKKIILSVERLDYSKGIRRKLLAIEKFLSLHPEHSHKTVFIMVLIPSRESVDRYRELKDQIELLIGNINGKHTTMANAPLLYIGHGVPISELTALYTLADICLVTPLIDGMNLVAKEYIACKPDGVGTLILSEFAGAAQELFNAILVNPYDIDGVASAINTALLMTDEERKISTLPMRKLVIKKNAKEWAREILLTLNELCHDKKNDTVKRLGKSLIHKFKNLPGKKALFLDYDGTLRDFENFPAAAVPTRDNIELIKQLSKIDNLDLYIISGRNQVFLEKYFSPFNLYLIGEHGFCIADCKHHESSESTAWKQLFDDVDLSWKPQVGEILDRFAYSTPGTLVEEKRTSLVWHYRKADPEFGKYKASELIGHLSSVISNLPVELRHGKMIVEVNSQSINKGNAVQKIITLNNYTSVMCLGDDRTDETMFRLKDKKIISIKVGDGDTEAHYRLASVKAVGNFLKLFS